MKRNGSLDEISDGKLYHLDDLVEVSCNGCKGSAACCRGMGSSIILDPYDIDRLSSNLNLSFEELLADKIELNVVDGIILPNLRMAGTSESCTFLNQAGKCSIHAFRPGICRIFPLGRYYENHNFNYILQKDECSNQCKTKMKVENWIDTTDIKKNQKFIIDWHYFLNEVESRLQESRDDDFIKRFNMYLLNSFYVKSYDKDRDFYLQFHLRLKEAKTFIANMQ